MIYEVRQTEEFRDWLRRLKDRKAAAKIAGRLVRLASGLIGDAKLFAGVGELRIDFGPGYRVYFVRRGAIVYVLLCGGTKGTQEKDIARAKRMAKEIADD
jgi:putative addiction module killer protein